MMLQKICLWKQVSLHDPLKEMTNKEWLKGRIEECEYTIEMLEELKQKIKEELLTYFSDKEKVE
tara:strand:- start:1231 stop:1422 length:192 start_codon:yes stop_codon:yes gene_type:complete